MSQFEDVATQPTNTVHVSPIFKWFKEDFKGDGALAEMLATYGPQQYREFFEKGDFDVELLLGHQRSGKLGEDYSAGVSALFKSIF